MHCEHTSYAGGSELGSWDWCYGSMVVFLDSYPNWIHQPNVLPHVPFRKGIKLRLRSWYTILWISHPGYSLALRLRNNEVPVWTHESIGYPKMDISHWDAAIHYGIQLAQYCDQTLSCNAISRRLPPLCSIALILRNTKVPVWTHESIGYPKWTSAIGTWQFTMAFSLPNIVIKPDLITLFHGDRPRCTPLP